MGKKSFGDGKLVKENVMDNNRREKVVIALVEGTLWVHGIRPDGKWTNCVPAFLQQAVTHGRIKPDEIYETFDAFTIATRNAHPGENCYVLIEIYGVLCRFRQQYKPGLLIPDDAILLVATHRNYEWLCSLPMVITYLGEWMPGLAHEIDNCPSAELPIGNEECFRIAG